MRDATTATLSDAAHLRFWRGLDELDAAAPASAAAIADPAVALPRRDFLKVMAASLANGGSFDNIMPGIQYFSDLKKSGNLQMVKVTKATLLSGEVPIALDWTYNFPALKPLPAKVAPGSE